MWRKPVSKSAHRKGGEPLLNWILTLVPSLAMLPPNANFPIVIVQSHTFLERARYLKVSLPLTGKSGWQPRACGPSASKDPRLHEGVPAAQLDAEDGEEDMRSEWLQRAAQLSSPCWAWQSHCQRFYGAGWRRRLSRRRQASLRGWRRGRKPWRKTDERDPGSRRAVRRKNSEDQGGQFYRGRGQEEHPRWRR